MRLLPERRLLALAIVAAAATAGPRPAAAGFVLLEPDAFKPLFNDVKINASSPCAPPSLALAFVRALALILLLRPRPLPAAPLACLAHSAGRRPSLQGGPGAVQRPGLRVGEAERPVLRVL